MPPQRPSPVRLLAWSVPAAILAAYASLAFRALFEALQALLFAADRGDLATATLGLPWWQVLLAPAAGGLAVGVLVRLTLPDARPLGVQHAIEAAVCGAPVSLRRGLAAAVACVASLGVGASVGREGPVIHLGATLGAALARRLRLAPRDAAILLGAGAAAAIAASFNAPLTGALFAVEVILRRYDVSMLPAIAVAAVAGTLIGRAHLGTAPVFDLAPIAAVDLAILPHYALIGAAAAGVAALFVRATFLVEDGWRRTPVPAWARPAAAGLALGALAIAVPEVLGVGYESTSRALHGGYALGPLLLLLAAKLAATAVCIGSGFAGGVVSPSLFIGAMGGGAYALIAAMLAPEALVPSLIGGAVAGMGAVAAVVLGAPFSTALFMFELTGSHAASLDMLLAVAVACALGRRLVGTSFFDGQIARRGVRLDGETSPGTP